jgi:hypothetical protein
VNDASVTAADSLPAAQQARRSSEARRSRFRWIAPGLFAAAVAGVILAAALGGSRSRQPLFPGVGTFGGYRIALDVKSVGASWTVPRIISTPTKAAAATWIGAQGQPSAFIQVGTVEKVATWPRHGFVPFYDAWWADTVSHYRARRLFAVRPGDMIIAALTHERASWTVSIRDATSGRGATFSTTEEGRGWFDLAEWVQEKQPSPGPPYPHVSPVSFQHVLVNGAPPDTTRLLSGWLATGEGLLAPTPLTGDAFTLHEVTITAAGAQYLRIVAPVDAATLRLRALVEAWYKNQSGWQRLRAGEHAYGESLEQEVRELREAHWPLAVSSYVSALMRSSAAYAQRVNSLPAVSPPPHGILERAWLREAEVLGETIHAVRRTLDLPDPV